MENPIVSQSACWCQLVENDAGYMNMNSSRRANERRTSLNTRNTYICKSDDMALYAKSSVESRTLCDLSTTASTGNIPWYLAS